MLDIRTWLLNTLEPVKHHKRVLVHDALRVLPENDSTLHTFARENGFTVIVASTNLVFRELYERASADSETKKILLVDRAPARRRAALSMTKAPPPFYPDFLAETAEEARIDLNLREFLRQTTGDPLWLAEANDPQYARLIVRHLDGVLRAHANLRRAHAGRFTDHDFKTIVAYAALGIAEAAFKRLDSKNLWRIGLLGHEALAELEALAPEIAGPIRVGLRKAPPPFCWFGDHDAEIVLRAFYLSVILAQHLPNWRLLLANIDPSLAPFSSLDEKMLTQAAPDLIQLDENQAHRDLEAVEQSLSKEAIQFLLLDLLKIGEPAGFATALEKERYSIFVRSLSLLMALDNLLSSQPAEEYHARLEALLFPEAETLPSAVAFADRRLSMTWSHLKEAYRLASEVQRLRGELNSLLKALTVRKADQLTYQFFWVQWNGKKINRLEYYLSALERLIASGDFLPRAEAELPSAFANALTQVKQRLHAIGGEVQNQLDEVNSRFQEMVIAQYPTWLTTDSEVRLTSQFIHRCLKSHWDSQGERAVIFIFDGMRYDIWDEMLRPMLVDRLEVIADLVASSLLPSETEISRWALAAGSAPTFFWPKRAENAHFKESLQREFNYQGEVEVVTPDGAGTGETVHYRAGSLDIYIFEFCDKELHKIQNKMLPDGRSVPGRPLAFIYQQHLKSLIDNEVMAIVRNLSAGTKVFITADHGFGRVHRERIGLETTWLNEPEDCSYLNAWLRQSLSDVKVPGKIRQNVWELSVDALGIPKTEESRDRRTKQTWQKQYASVIFPKTGFALSRPGAHFNPDAYTHGGISMQELMIPMVVLRVKARDEGLLLMDQIIGPRELGEGEEVEFRVQLNCAPSATPASDELRVDLEAVITAARPVAEEIEAAMTLPHQVVYVPPQGCDVVFRYRFDSLSAGNAERKAGTLERTLTVTASYHEGRKMHRKSRTQRFTVRLNSEQIIRRVGNLGNILGLTPKSMR